MEEEPEHVIAVLTETLTRSMSSNHPPDWSRVMRRAATPCMSARSREAAASGVCARELLERGFVYSRARHADKPDAWEYAREVFAAATDGDPVDDVWRLASALLPTVNAVIAAAERRRDARLLKEGAKKVGLSHLVD